MIWTFCSPSRLVAYSAVLDLGSEMAASEHCRRLSIPLLDIESWSRGAQCNITLALSTPCYV